MRTLVLLLAGVTLATVSGCAQGHNTATPPAHAPTPAPAQTWNTPPSTATTPAAVPTYATVWAAPGIPYAQVQPASPYVGNQPVRWGPCAMWRWTWPGADAEQKTVMAEAFTQLSNATGIPGAEAQRGEVSNVRISTGEIQPWQTDPGLEGYGWASALYDSSAHPQYSRAVMTISDKLGPGRKYDDHDLWLATYLHELGHVAGLGHSREENTIMVPKIDPNNVSYTDADRAALRTVKEPGLCVGGPKIVPEPTLRAPGSPAVGGPAHTTGTETFTFRFG